MMKKIALGLVLTSAAALPVAAMAGDQGTDTPVGSTSDAQTMTVVRDSVTGKLRQPTAEEATEMQNQRTLKRQARRIAPATPLTKYHGSGATGARVTDDMMSYSVMVRLPDGTLSEQCFASKEDADAAVKNGSLTAKSALPTE